MMSVGYEKRKAGAGIEREDLYNLAPPDTVDMFYPPFERDWNKSINRWRNRSGFIFIFMITAYYAMWACRCSDMNKNRK